MLSSGISVFSLSAVSTPKHWTSALGTFDEINRVLVEFKLIMKTKRLISLCEIHSKSDWILPDSISFPINVISLSIKR